jgi:hypothetical protein
MDDFYVGKKPSRMRFERAYLAYIALLLPYAITTTAAW